MVVLSRQQLFTENTITVVLPVMKQFSLANLGRLGRLWSIVFAANMTGTFFAALFCTFTPVLPPELRHGMLEISHHMMENDRSEMFFKGISAGFLIAAMVWLVPSADTAKFHAVTLMTYLIAIGGFTHIVAGSMEAFLLVANGQLGVRMMIADFVSRGNVTKAVNLTLRFGGFSALARLAARGFVLLAHRRVVFSSDIGKIDGRFGKRHAKLLHCIGDDLRYGQIAKPLVVGGDHVPRRITRAGCSEGILESLHIFIP
jgi:Formate/nitrite transporter